MRAKAGGEDSLDIDKIILILADTVSSKAMQIESYKADIGESGANSGNANVESVETHNSTAQASSIETQLLNYINNIRVQEGLQKLNPNQVLISIARSRSADMVNRNYFSHYTPEGKSIEKRH
jgi:uncharacterized protein YkwD